MYVHGGNRGWLKGVSVLHFFVFLPQVTCAIACTANSALPQANWPTQLVPGCRESLDCWKTVSPFSPFRTIPPCCTSLVAPRCPREPQRGRKASRHRLHRSASTRIAPQVKIQARWSRWSRWWLSTDGRGRAAVSSTHPPREAQRLPGPRYYHYYEHLLCPEKDQDIS